MSASLTVPSTLAAGLSGAIDSSTVVITRGLSDVIVRAIAMELGEYLSARADAEHFAAKREWKIRETVEVPDREFAEVAEISGRYRARKDDVRTLTESICVDQKR